MAEAKPGGDGCRFESQTYIGGVFRILHLVIEAYSLVLLGSVISSWLLAPSHPLRRWLDQVTEPVLGPLRRVIPSVSGFDLTPMVALLILNALGRLL